MTFMQLIMVLHVAATLFMGGIIWFIQIVHYPLFDRVGGETFARYAADNLRITSYVVVLPMLVEASTAVLLLLFPPDDLHPSLLWLGFGLVILVWLSTIFVQLPLHRRLTMGFERRTYRVLLGSNWIRTSAWSLRGVLVITMLLNQPASA